MIDVMLVSVTWSLQICTVNYSDMPCTTLSLGFLLSMENIKSSQNHWVCLYFFCILHSKISWQFTWRIFRLIGWLETTSWPRPRNQLPFQGWILSDSCLFKWSSRSIPDFRKVTMAFCEKVQTYCLSRNFGFPHFSDPSCWTPKSQNKKTPALQVSLLHGLPFLDFRAARRCFSERIWGWN